MFRKDLDRGEAGDNMGVLLRGLKREQIERGQVIAAPGSIQSVKKFQAQLYVSISLQCSYFCALTSILFQILTKDEGGRYTPFVQNYQPQLFVRSANVTINLSWPEGTTEASTKMVMPGDNVEMICELVHDVAADVGTRFTLREGGKTGTYCLRTSLPAFL